MCSLLSVLLAVVAGLLIRSLASLVFLCLVLASLAARIGSAKLGVGVVTAWGHGEGPLRELACLLHSDDGEEWGAVVAAVGGGGHGSGTPLGQRPRRFSSLTVR